MKIGFIQFVPKFGNKKENIAKIKKLVKNNNADLFVLPEMCTTGYMVASRKELISMAESIDGPTVQSLIDVARKNNTCIIFGLPELFGDKVFSTAVVVDPDGVIAKHQKSHLFLKEKIFFNQGETKPTIFEWRGAKIGLGVCYDYMFPEYWRVLGLRGVDIFCNTANFVFDYGFKMMQARSIENGVFSITVNRVGVERGQKFKGGSEIVDNKGNILAKGNDTECVKVVEVDPTISRNKKWNEYNDLFKDRRIDLYKEDY
ncbi:beta-ureidopropionase [Candidatus Nomurabacteria bacterium]|nr:beta-ureidopropionase [Candidatus Nomurabacteria bacterium]